MRLIDADKLIELLNNDDTLKHARKLFKAYIEEQKTINIRKVVKGKWIKFSSDEWCCPYCGEVRHFDTLDGVYPTPFCPECGADLREE